jgi:tetratricopeptide (TPR) repeat protein
MAMNKFIEEGDRKYFKGDYKGAVKLYTRAIEQSPQLDEAYLKRGMAYLDLSKFHEAIENFNKAIELNSQNSDAFRNRALAKYSLNLSKEALADYNEAARLSELQ